MTREVTKLLRRDSRDFSATRTKNQRLRNQARKLPKNPTTRTKKTRRRQSRIRKRKSQMTKKKARMKARKKARMMTRMAKAKRRVLARLSEITFSAPKATRSQKDGLVL